MEVAVATVLMCRFRVGGLQRTRHVTTRILFS
jgi:hypothetical protein